MRVFLTNLIVGFSILLTATANFAQTGAGVDAAFAPQITGQGSSQPLNIKIQSDGKLLVSGSSIVNRVARLNTDGSRDASFNCNACGSLTVVSVAVQPDGKILVAGKNTETSAASIIRVNADGSADTSFSGPVFSGTDTRLIVYGVQADGKIYIGAFQISPDYGSYGITGIFRLNPDGSVDNTFNSILNQDSSPGISTINLEVLADGRVFVYGKDSAFGPISQLNPNGSKNTAFESPTLSNNGNPGTGVNDIATQSDGKIVFVGSFQTVNGQGRDTVARLNTNGTLDLGFSTASLYGNFATREASTIDTLPNGKFLVGSSNTIRKPTRLNADGTIDTTYNPPSDIYGLGKVAVDSLGRAYIYAGFTSTNNIGYRLVRLTADGALDSTYNADPGIVSGITALAVNGDGKIIVGGAFNKVNGTAENTITRINADGTTDVSFNAGTGFNGAIKDLAVQTNGKVIVVGTFSTINGVARQYAARLNADGSLDTSFNLAIDPSNQSIYAATVQSDGKFLTGGQFALLINGVSHTAILRYNADGSLDGAFNPAFQQDGRIYDLLVQSDGKIMAVGTFVGVNGVNRTNIVRLNADGTTDTSFNAAVNTSPLQIIQQPDGKYLIRTNGTIYRLNANGSSDGSFAFAGSTAYYLETMSLQPNGTIVIGGTFDTINGQPRKNIARLLPDGSLDVLYFPRSADNTVNVAITQADGRVIAGGQFTNIGGVNRYGIARLAATSVIASSKFDFDGDGKADISVFRPSNGFWYVQGSQNGISGAQFGASTDRLAPADYDGDGKTDFAVFRDGNWYVMRSSRGFLGAAFGQAGDIPQPADFDGDGRTELVVWRPSNGTWYVWNLFNDQRKSIQFGAATDKPVIADYDGDGKADYAVVRQSGGVSVWYILGSTQGFYGLQFGTDTDKPVPADYDGDGKTDVAVFRPGNGTWYLNRSSAGFTGAQFGIATDLPVAADYDGDGKSDIAVFRDGIWYLNRSTSGFIGIGFGANTDKPVPNSYVP